MSPGDYLHSFCLGNPCLGDLGLQRLDAQSTVDNDDLTCRFSFSWPKWRCGQVKAVVADGVALPGYFLRNTPSRTRT